MYEEKTFKIISRRNNFLIKKNKLETTNICPLANSNTFFYILSQRLILCISLPAFTFFIGFGCRVDKTLSRWVYGIIL